MLFLLLIAVCSASQLRIESQEQQDVIRLDLIPEDRNVHPELIKVVACGGTADSCKGKGMIRRVLFSSHKHRNLDGRVSLEDEGRILMVEKAHLPKGDKQFVEMHTWLKNPDGTKVQDSACVVTVEVGEKKVERAPYQQQVDHRQSSLPWAVYTGIGLATTIVIGVAVFGLYAVYEKRQAKKNEPEVAYGGVYQFAGDQEKKVLTKSDYEKLEDFELAKKVCF